MSLFWESFQPVRITSGDPNWGRIEAKMPCSLSSLRFFYVFPLMKASFQRVKT